MFFTEEDYKKIEQYLINCGVKDSCLEGAVLPFQGNEKITIVQDGKNRTLYFRELIEALKHSKAALSDLYNVTDHVKEKYITLKKAIELVPYKARKLGQIITFLNPDSKWELYQFTGASILQWNELSLWNDLFNLDEYIVKSILPDEEDLTKSEPNGNGNSYLSLKDREYNPAEFSGLGRVILRKNIMEVESEEYGKVKKNVLLQDMINKPNTIYEIRYDFDLNNQEITIPEGCVLDFQGGKLSNGIIKGNYTDLNNRKSKHDIIENILVKGTFTNASLKFLQKLDISEAIQYLLDTYHYIKFDEGIYYTSKQININYSRTLIEGEGKCTIIEMKNTNNIDSMFYVKKKTTETYYAVSYTCIKNLYLKGNYNTNNCINNQGVSCSFENLFIEKFKDSGIISDTCWCSNFSNLLITYCNIGINLTNLAHNNTITNCRIESNRYYDIFIGSSAAVIISGCVLESGGCKTNIYILNCRGTVIENNYFEGQKILLGKEVAVSEATSAVFNNDTKFNSCIIIGGITDFSNNIFARYDNYWPTYQTSICNNHIESETSGSLVLASNSKGLTVNDNSTQSKDPLVLILDIKDCVVQDLQILRNTYVKNKDRSNCIPLKMLLADILYYRDSSTHIVGNCNIQSETQVYYNNIAYWGNYIQPSMEDEFKYLSTIFNSSCYQVDVYPTQKEDQNYIQFGVREKKVNEGLYCFEVQIKVKEIKNKEDQMATLCIRLYDKFNNVVLTKEAYIKTSLDDFQNSKIYTYVDNINYYYISAFVQFNNNGNKYTIKNPKVYKVGEENTDINYYIGSCSPYRNVNLNGLYTKGIVSGTIANDNNKSKICIKSVSPDNYDVWKDNELVIKNNGIWTDTPNNPPIGFAYFCTDKQTTEGTTNGIMIYHKGNNVWVDALGRVVN